MPDDVIVQPGDTVVIADPSPVVEAVAIETAVATAVAEGVRIAEEGTEQWAKLSYDVLNAMLVELREQRAEMETRQMEMTLRLKDLTEQQIATNQQLGQVLAAPVISPLSTLPTEPMIVPEIQPEVIPERTDEPAVEENPEPKIVKQKTRRLI